MGPFPFSQVNASANNIPLAGWQKLPANCPAEGSAHSVPSTGQNVPEIRIGQQPLHLGYDRALPSPK